MLTFLYPGLLWGMLLSAVPLILHLVYRRTHRRLPWAAMRHLRIAVAQQRSWWQFRQWILLGLRMAAIALLFLLLAQPTLSTRASVPWLIARDPVEHLIVWDDSLSMQASAAENGPAAASSTPWQVSQLAMRQVLQQLPAHDRVTLLLATRPESPLAVDESAAELLQRWPELSEATSVTDRFVAWPSLLQRLSTVPPTSRPLDDLVLVTDLARHGWETPLATTDFASSFPLPMHVLDVGQAVPPNASLRNVSMQSRHAIVGVPVTWHVTMRTPPQRPRHWEYLEWETDGDSQHVPLPEFIPSSETTIHVSHTFSTPGLHTVLFRSPPDCLLGDNEYRTVVDVRPHIDVWLVSGSASSRPMAGDSDLIALALRVGPGIIQAMRVRVLTAQAMHDEAASSTTIPSRPQLIIWANVPRPAPPVDRLLKDWVAQGTGFLVFLGSAVQEDDYHQAWYESGSGFMPLQIEGQRDMVVHGVTLADAVGDTSFAALADLKASVLDRVLARRIMAVRPDADAKILATWNTPDRTPAVVEATWGLGKTQWWSVPATTDWSNWPIDPSFVLATHESVLQLADAPRLSRQVTAGEPIEIPLPDTPTVLDPMVVRPDATSEVPRLVAQVDETTARHRPATRGALESNPQLIVAQTSLRGFHALQWQDPRAQGITHDAWAVNADTRESELTRIPRNELRERLAPLPVEVTAWDQFQRTSGASQKLWRTMLFGLIVLLVLESCWATWMSVSLLAPTQVSEPAV